MPDGRHGRPGVSTAGSYLSGQLQSAFGALVLLGLAWLASEDQSRVPWRIVL